MKFSRLTTYRTLVNSGFKLLWWENFKEILARNNIATGFQQTRPITFKSYYIYWIILTKLNFQRAVSHNLLKMQ